MPWLNGSFSTLEQRISHADRASSPGIKRVTAPTQPSALSEYKHITLTFKFLGEHAYRVVLLQRVEINQTFYGTFYRLQLGLIRECSQGNGCQLLQLLERLWTKVVAIKRGCGILTGEIGTRGLLHEEVGHGFEDGQHDWEDVGGDDVASQSSAVGPEFLDRQKEIAVLWARCQLDEGGEGGNTHCCITSHHDLPQRESIVSMMRERDYPHLTSPYESPDPQICS